MHFTNIHSLAKIPQNHLNYFKNVQLLHSTRCTAVCSNKTLCTLGPVNVNKIYCLMQCSRGEREEEGERERGKPHARRRNSQIAFWPQFSYSSLALKGLLWGCKLFSCQNVVSSQISDWLQAKCAASDGEKNQLIYLNNELRLRISIVLYGCSLNLFGGATCSIHLT